MPKNGLKSVLQILRNLHYKYNTVKIQFAAPFFDDESKNLYSHQLIGFDKNWSDWTQEGNAVYTNLREGTYSFQVKAKNLYDKESIIGSYQIKILPPWYRSWWAYISYIIFSSIGIWGIVKWNSRRLEKEKEYLENIVEIRTVEVVKQKDEILEKSLELEQQKEELAIQRDNIVASYENNKMLSEIGYQITATLDLNSILNIIHKNIEKLMPTDIFAIGLYDEKNSQIDYQMAIENGKKYKPYSRDMNDKNQFAVWCIENKKEVFINDVAKEYTNYLTIYQNEKTIEFEDGTLAQKPSSLIYLPLLIQKKILGIITVQSFVTNAYTDWHKNMLGTLGVYLSSALENYHAYHEIDAQKIRAEGQHRDIIASINVAKRIQDAMLPSLQDIRAVIPNSFVLFKPRDIVSGDFYWISETKRAGKNYVVVAIADCTGHGVPGAFLSMVGCNILNNLVKENKVTEPQRILTLLDKEVCKTLQQGKDNSKEGMDMAIITLTKDPNSKKEEQKFISLEYAGAMNPLYYVQNKLFNEIKGSKEPINSVKLRKMLGTPFVAKHFFLYYFSIKLT